MELTPTFMALLEGFSFVFTAPSFETFRLLMSGWIISIRHRYVTDLIVSSDSVGNGHFSDYHRFFSQAAWSIDVLWRQTATLVISTFLGNDVIIILAADDTLCRKRGLSVFGAGMHHDPLISSRAMKLVSWGHDWVILSIIVTNCRWAPNKVFALPICARLYRNRQGLTKKQKKDPRQSRSSQTRKSTATGKASKTSHKTRPELLAEMLSLVASWFPNRRFHLVADSLYSGKSILSCLPENMELTGPVHPKAALYAPAPKNQENRRGPRRKKGERLPTRDEWAANRTGWTRVKFEQYGLHGTFRTKTRKGLYYKAGKDRLLRLVLTQDAEGDRPTQIFYTTNVDQSVRDTLSMFSYRWATEVMHFDAKQHLGLEDPANRTELAVQRTAPMALFLYTLTIVWFEQHGHHHVRFPDRPWYPQKSEPSFGDMLTTLRRKSWEEKLSPVRKNPTVRAKMVRLLTYLATLAG